MKLNIKLQSVNPSGTELGIFRENQNAMADDALAPWVAGTSPAMVLIWYDTRPLCRQCGIFSVACAISIKEG